MQIQREDIVKIMEIVNVCFAGFEVTDVGIQRIAAGTLEVCDIQQFP